MRAISLWQPWASAIPAGLKTIETRSWPTPYRGPLAIHAAKRNTNDEREFWRNLSPETRDAFKTIGIDCHANLPFGAIVATCEIYGCFSTSGDVTPDHHVPAPSEGDWGNFSPNRYAWLLRNIRSVPKPIPCVGRQGFFDVQIAP